MERTIMIDMEELLNDMKGSGQFTLVNGMNENTIHSVREILEYALERYMTLLGVKLNYIVHIGRIDDGGYKLEYEKLDDDGNVVNTKTLLSKEVNTTGLLKSLLEIVESIGDVYKNLCPLCSFYKLEAIARLMNRFSTTWYIGEKKTRELVMEYHIDIDDVVELLHRLADVNTADEDETYIETTINASTRYKDDVKKLIVDLGYQCLVEENNSSLLTLSIHTNLK